MVQSYYFEWEVQHGISQEEPIGKTEALLCKEPVSWLHMPIGFTNPKYMLFSLNVSNLRTAFMGQFMSDAILKYVI